MQAQQFKCISEIIFYKTVHRFYKKKSMGLVNTEENEVCAWI